MRELLPQRGDAGLAAGIDLHIAFGGADIDHQRHAQQIAADAARIEVVAGKAQRAANLGQRRQVAIHHQAVAVEAETAVDLRAGQLAQRQPELELELAVALGAHVLGEMVDALADRTGFDEAKEIRRRAGGLAAHQEHFVGLLKIGDLGAHLAQLDAEALAALARDQHALAREQQLAVDVVDLGPGGGIAQLGLLELAAHLEEALLAIAERKIPEVAAQSQRGVGGLAADDRAAQPVAHVLADHQRHVAPNGLATATRQAGLHVDPPRALLQRAPGAAGFAGRIAVVEGGLVQRHVQAIVGDAPIGVGGEGFEFEQGIGEHRRQLEHGLVAVEPE